MCITAGAWIIRDCRRSICSSPAIRIRPCRRCSNISAVRANRPSSPRHRALCQNSPTARSRSNISHSACGRRSAIATSRSRICRCPGTAPGGRSAIRSIISAAMAAAVSAAAPAFRSARRWRCKGSGRLPVAICGDGDYLMSVTALWTAAHYRIPLLLVIANNRSFFNDELHQERVARMRNRPVENRWIGQRISDPDIDLASLARAQGAQAWGPIETQADLAASYAKAIEAVENGGVAVVDVRVEPGYAPAMTAVMSRKEMIAMSVAPMPSPRPAAVAETGRHPRRRRRGETLSDTGRRDHRRRSCLVRGAAGRIPLGHRSVRLRQVDPVQHHRRARHRLRRHGHRRGRAHRRARMPRSAWCSRRNRPFPGAR